MSNSAKSLELPDLPPLQNIYNKELNDTAIHHIVSIGIHATTCSAILTNPVQEVSKPYVTQITNRNFFSGIIIKAPKLKGIQVDLPIETISFNFLELSRSLKTLLNGSDNLDFYIVNLDPTVVSSSIEYNYADIFVYNIPIQAIVTSGALFNIY